MNKRHYEHTLPNIRGSLSNTYGITDKCDKADHFCFHGFSGFKGLFKQTEGICFCTHWIIC